MDPRLEMSGMTGGERGLRGFGTGAQARPQAPGEQRGRAALDAAPTTTLDPRWVGNDRRGRKQKDGSSITNVEDDRGGGRRG